MHRQLPRNAAGEYIVRLRFGKGRRDRFTLPASLRSDVAQRRATRLQELASALGGADARAASAALETACECGADEAIFERAIRAARKLVVNEPSRHVATDGKTFRELGEDWTSGRLATRYPGQIKLKRTAADDAGRLTNHIYPVIGAKPLEEVTLDDCDEVMRRIPSSAARSRQHVAGTLLRLFTLAVYPLRLIERSPLPTGFLPARGPRKAFAYLYPDEDRRLMACAEVPLAWRMLWGFLAREGMREGEALGLIWTDVDLKRGMVKLDKNKTDDPRAWPLDAGVHAALRTYRELAPSGVLVFTDPRGRTPPKYTLAPLLRAHLAQLGLKDERPELFESTDARQQMRVHDLRGTFVTIALATGRTEAWVSARTGHRTSNMIARYKRVADSFEELGLGKLDPLNEAIPELRVGHQLGHTTPKSKKLLVTPTGIEPVLPA